MASTACSVGDRPRGWEGPYIYLLLVRIHSFIHQCERSSMLSIGGRGMLLNAIYPYRIVQVLSRGTVMAVLCKGVPSIVVFKILPSHVKTFHYAL
jgi:hypothetical protein